jgi:hypothetical protein
VPAKLGFDAELAVAEEQFADGGQLAGFGQSCALVSEAVAEFSQRFAESYDNGALHLVYRPV